MSDKLITQIQFEAVRRYFLSRAYELLNVDPEYKLYCHIPGKLVSLSYLETFYAGEFNIPQKGNKRVFVFFGEEGDLLDIQEPYPEILLEIPLNSHSGKPVDKDLLMSLLVRVDP